jgi:hypothetical protein
MSSTPLRENRLAEQASGRQDEGELDGRWTMIPYRPESAASLGRVIKFRPRMVISRGGRLGNVPVDKPAPNYSPVADLGKYERSESDDDDYRHRMRVNAIAAAFTSILILAGVWLTSMMMHA